MLSIFICEDNPEHLEQITKCIRNYVLIENLPMKIMCSTAFPGEVLDYLRDNKVAGLYFLDVDLSCEMDGIKLAEAIRTYDPRGFIVFITADAESLMLTFKYKVEAMDYIVKGDFDLNGRICECLRNAHDKYTAKPTPLQNYFILKPTKDETIVLDCSKILYFEAAAAPHKIFVYTETGRYRFRGELSQIQKELNGFFFKCHRSIVVNIEKVASIDTSLLKLQLHNGDTIDVSIKHIKGVKELMQKLSAKTDI
ncbi:MAG: LytTR family DNA-binding domain-containing protein [Clostridiales bacterium]|nr:LytTR family DNA-binding domain-containing protein [Clostridiales bacterium]